MTTTLKPHCGCPSSAAPHAPRCDRCQHCTPHFLSGACKRAGCTACPQSTGPAFEPIVLARAPMATRTATGSRAKHGTGMLHVEPCRLPFASEADEAESKGKNQHEGYANPGSNRDSWSGEFPARTNYDAPGRWPPNVAIDEDVAALLDEQAGERQAGARPARRLNGSSFDHSGPIDYGVRLETPRGGASRFFYCPKADRAEREVGMDGAEERHGQAGSAHALALSLGDPLSLERAGVLPERGIVLDPFAGSGSTGIAALAEGFLFLGIEADPHAADIARRRIGAGSPKEVLA